MNEAQNVGLWTLYDMMYRGKRIEIKETSYYHAWQTDEEPKSKQRSFGISMAYDDYLDPNSEFRRQNDIYIFCLNTGETKAESDPLMLEHWEFYIIPTYEINKRCKNGKTISLSRVRKMTKCVVYDELKTEVDKVIEHLDAVSAHEYSKNNRISLNRDTKCGCFYCLSIYDPKEITEWLDSDSFDKDGTAVCPYCGCDTVIGEGSGYSISTEFLKRMKEYWIEG